MVIDLKEARERVDGDKETYIIMIEAFFEEYEIHLKGMKEGIAKNEPATLSKHAHTIKGALGNLAVKHGYELAYQLESLGKRGSLDGAEELVKSIDDQVFKFKADTDRIINGKLWEQEG